MVVYRQISNSSWNRRTDLQKAVVNMRVFHEANKVEPKMKRYSFMKCQSSWKKFYENRKSKIEDKCNVDFVINEKFVSETLEYYDAGILAKILYELKYFIPTHCGLYIRIVRKLARYTYRKI